MFCINCGAQIPDDSRFCTKCGTPVTPLQPVVPVNEAPTPVQAEPVPTTAPVEPESDEFFAQETAPEPIVAEVAPVQEPVQEAPAAEEFPAEIPVEDFSADSVASDGEEEPASEDAPQEAVNDDQEANLKRREAKAMELDAAGYTSIAAQELLELAEEGSAFAQGVVAEFYAGMTGGNKTALGIDLDKAVYWFNKCLEQGDNAIVERELALCIQQLIANGSTEVTQEDFIAHLDKAVEGGDIDAIMLRANLCLGEDDARAAELSKLAASQGSIDGCCLYAACLEDDGTTPEDKAEMIENYSLASRSGNEYATYRLALCYLNGNGVERDVRQGTFLLASIAPNNIEAQAMLDEAWSVPQEATESDSEA